MEHIEKIRIGASNLARLGQNPLMSIGNKIWRSRWTADISLLLVALVWGTTYVASKDVVSSVPVMQFLFIRFLLTTILMLPLTFSAIKKCMLRRSTLVPYQVANRHNTVALVRRHSRLIRLTAKGVSRVKGTMVSILFALLLLVGCGNVTQTTSPSRPSSTDGVQPPKASVTIGSQQIQPVINGYQWSDGNHSSIADAASDPAKDLKKYDATVGEKVTLSFDRKPKSVQITMWSNGKQALTSPLNNPSFSLPSHAGDYTYEVTGHWGNDYVNYDFKVHVH